MARRDREISAAAPPVAGSTVLPIWPQRQIARWRDAILDDEKLSAGEKLTAMAIARFADSASAKTFASAPRLARLASLAERSVRTHTLRLIEAGYVRAVRKPQRSSRAWATRELVLLLPRGAATIAGPQSRGAATVAAAQARGAAKNDARCGKKRREVRQRLPTIPYISRSIPGPAAPADFAESAALGPEIEAQIGELAHAGMTSAAIAKRLRRETPHVLSTRQVDAVLARQQRSLPLGPCLVAADKRTTGK
ncbi:MAG TPA: helix-turn-helix domain-containing protein [Steroidobacteraceae bacterium]|jgi:hypothetical protein